VDSLKWNLVGMLYPWSQSFDQPPQIGYLGLNCKSTYVAVLSAFVDEMLPIKSPMYMPLM